MDIKQQTKNVAAQGRFGDSMLLHVNPAEVKGLASSMPITTNPETGQPEAFLPFLAPMLGSLLGPSVLGGLGGLGLSSAALSGIGAGLATYAQTGGSGSKALLSGLTAGLGAKALEGVANPGLDTAIADAQVTAGIGTPVDPSFVGPIPPPPPTTLASQQAAEQAVRQSVGGPGASLQKIFSPGLDEGIKSLGSAAMTPTGMLAAGAAGTGAVMQSQEDFEAMLRQMDIDEEERKRLMYERYPEQIPMASGGRTGFYHGGIHNPRIDAQRAANNIVFDVPDTNYSNINYGLDGIGDGFNAYSTPPRRTTRPISRGFMPGFMPEYSYFEGMNPSATALGYDPLGNFQNPQLVNQGGYSQPSRGRGGFGGLFGRSRGLQPLSPPGGFRDKGGYGYTPPPPQFAGYSNPFMQSPSYQGFYGVPQMQQMINPYARFTQQPMPYQSYQPYQPPQTPPPSDGGDTPPPDDSGITPPPDDGGGRKGRIRNIEPISPPDDFITPGPIDRPMPIDIPINQPQPALPISNDGPRFEPITPINQPIIKNTPPPTITIPIEGGADVTIPDFSKINIPNPRDNFMSIERIGDNRTNEQLRPQGIKPIPDFRATKDRGELIESIDRIGNNPPKIGQITDMRARYDGPPLQAKPFTPPSPAAPANNPPRMSIGGPGGGRGGIFGAPMFAEGESTNKELPNEGLRALAKTEKGREAIKAMGYQEGQDVNMPMSTNQSTDMMQDPIVQETIQFILGETDNSDVVNEFIVKYGQEQFMMLRNMILAQAAGNSDVQTEGLIQGTGRSGMADDLPMNIGDKPIAAVSQDEYIIPADVVSMLGDGSSDAGSKQLDSMLDRIRTEKTGTTKQAKPLNTSKVLPV